MYLFGAVSLYPTSHFLICSFPPYFQCCRGCWSRSPPVRGCCPPNLPSKQNWLLYSNFTATWRSTTSPAWRNTWENLPKKVSAWLLHLNWQVQQLAAALQTFFEIHFQSSKQPQPLHDNPLLTVHSELEQEIHTWLLYLTRKKPKGTCEGWVYLKSPQRWILWCSELRAETKLATNLQLDLRAE